MENKKYKEQQEASIGKTSYGLTKTIYTGRLGQIKTELDKCGHLESRKEEQLR